MASVFDVAAYILERRGRMTAMKLQKLVYYSQAWSLVWDGRPLFDDEVQAWVNGPVVYDLFKAHQGMFEIERADLGHGNSHVSMQRPPRQLTPCLTTTATSRRSG